MAKHVVMDTCCQEIHYPIRSLLPRSVVGVCDVEFHESTSWYSLPTSTTNEDPIPEDEASEPEPVQIEDRDNI